MLKGCSSKNAEKARVGAYVFIKSSADLLLEILNFKVLNLKFLNCNSTYLQKCSPGCVL